MSSTLKKIESNTSSSMGSLKDVFGRVQGAMLNLGQVAQGIHNIFETNERVTRNLENAMDRLENAKIRLKQATQDLTHAERKLVDIEQAHERDSLSLERAQLRLEEAQSEYNKALRGGWENTKYLKEVELNLKEAQFDLTDAQRQAEKKTQELSDASQELKDKQENLIISGNGVDKATRGMEKATSDASYAYWDMGIQAVSVLGNMGSLLTALNALGLIQPIITAAQWAWNVALNANPIGLVVLAVAALVAAFMNWDKIIGVVGASLLWLKDNVLMPVWNFIERVISGIERILGFKSGTGNAGLAVASGAGVLGVRALKGAKATGGQITSTGNYLLQKGEYVTPRNGGGNVININGPIYGINPRQISEELYKRLRYSITT